MSALRVRWKRCLGSWRHAARPEPRPARGSSAYLKDHGNCGGRHDQYTNLLAHIELAVPASPSALDREESPYTPPLLGQRDRTCAGRDATTREGSAAGHGHASTREGAVGVGDGRGPRTREHGQWDWKD